MQCHDINIVVFVHYCCEQDQGITVLTNATKVCTEAIEKRNGKLAVNEADRAVSVLNK